MPTSTIKLQYLRSFAVVAALALVLLSYFLIGPSNIQVQSIVDFPIPWSIAYQNSVILNVENPAAVKTDPSVETMTIKYQTKTTETHIRRPTTVNDTISTSESMSSTSNNQRDSTKKTAKEYFDASVFSQREKHLQEECLSIGKKKSSGLAMEKTIWINKTMSLLTCRVFKAASTELWNYIYQLMGGPPLRGNEGDKWNSLSSYIQRKAPPIDVSSFLRNHKSDSFKTRSIIVREPFSRFLSAYKNKIAKMHPFYYNKYGKHILRNYDHKEPPITAELAVKNNVIPSFQGFMAFALTHMDPHWIPVSTLCRPCDIQFNIILKAEYPEELDDFVRNIMKLKDPKPFRPSENHTKTALTAAQYYEKVPEALKRRLYNLYSMDYRLFDYPYPEFAFL